MTTDNGLNGIFRRRVVARAEGLHVRAAVEDDLHHFEVDVVHDGRVVIAVEGRSIRYPWTTCPQATASIGLLAGTAVALPVKVAPEIDARLHCTHLYELARLAIAQAARGGSRQYDIEMPDRVDDLSRATIKRDGEVVFIWDLDGYQVIRPDAFAGIEIMGRISWPDEVRRDADALEACLILRRAITVASIRNPGKEGIRDGTSPIAPFDETRMIGACFSYQPDRAKLGRVHTSWQDFTARPDDLLKAGV